MIAVTKLCQRAPQRASQKRRGVSVFEFTGYFGAMVGGVILGSMYLGVDVKEMAYTALERANVIDPRPAVKDTDANDATAAATTGATPAATAPAGATSGEVAPTQPTTTNVTPTGHPAAPSTGPAPAPSTTTATLPAEAPPGATVPPAAPDATAPAPATGFFARADLITDQQREALTRAYWDALAVCMQDEVRRRVPAIDAEGNWQLFDYLTGRKDGHQKAAVAIAALDMRGVDDHVLAYSKKARAWHEDGAKLFGRAVDLLTDAPTAQLTGPFAQSWQSAATQHRMESRLLTEKLQSVQKYLDHAYQADGAPQPATQSAGQPAAQPAAQPAGQRPVQRAAQPRS